MKIWQKEILRYGEIYEVGGAVRDKIINPEIKIKDIDYLVTGIPMDKLVNLLKKFGYCNFVGKSFGVIKFSPKNDDVVIDIALPRQEYSVGVGHKDFVVKYDHKLNVEDDLVRRDFTINAVAFNLRTKQFVDPTGGINDIKKKLLRMITKKSFLDDPLRMLRAVQFSARFKFKIEKTTFDAIKKYAYLIPSVSAERVQEEFNKLLTKSDKPSIGLKLMSETRILDILFPELSAGRNVDQNVYHKHDVMMHNFYTCDSAPKENLVVRLAALFHDIGKVKKKKVIKDKLGKRIVFYQHEQESAKLTKTVLRRLRYSNDIIEKVTHLISMHMFEYKKEWSDAAVRRFMRRVGVENVDDWFLLRKADRIANAKRGFDSLLIQFRERIQNEIKKSSAIDLKSLAVNGNDVMETLKITPGPIVGKVLNKLLELVLENPELNTREILLKKIVELKDVK